MRALLISPDPSSNTGGVERFCHLLGAVLESAGWTTQLIGPTASVPAGLARLGLEPSLQAVSVTRRARAEHVDLVIGNGFLGGPAGRDRIHVFHGTMVKHVAAGEDRQSPLPAAAGPRRRGPGGAVRTWGEGSGGVELHRERARAVLSPAESTR